MRDLVNTAAQIDPEPRPLGIVVDICAARPASEPAFDDSLRCVSSGYMADGCSCPATIPARVVEAAWCRQRARGEASEEGLFRFAWQGELWLAFSQAGEIRGVYCPTHLAERESRACALRAVPAFEPGLALSA